MVQPLRIVLAGVGGYGVGYVNGLLAPGRANEAQLVGAVDPYPAGDGYEKLQAAGIPVYPSLEAYYAAHGSADLAILSTPIQFHAEQTCYCLEKGSHVLVEKPIAPTLAEAKAMIATRDKSGRQLVVGYQWCFDDTLQKLHELILSGRLGAPKKLRAIVLWPRNEAYYHRGTGWAGKRYTKDGHPIFDNVASNATAHYLMNMLWMAGFGQNGTTLGPVDVRVAKANAIETYDSICANIALTNGAQLSYAASHAIAKDEIQQPMFEYGFEHATVSFGGIGITGSDLVVRYEDGTESNLGLVEAGEAGLRKVWKTINVIQGKAPNPCPAELAMAHTLLMDTINEKIGAETPVFAQERIQLDDTLHWVPGLRDTMFNFYNTQQMPDAL